MDFTTTIRRCPCGRDIGGSEYVGRDLCRACTRKTRKPESDLVRIIKVTGGSVSKISVVTRGESRQAREQIAEAVSSKRQWRLSAAALADPAAHVAKLHAALEAHLASIRKPAKPK